MDDNMPNPRQRDLSNRESSSKGLPQIWNDDIGQWENFDGHAGHSGLITVRATSTDSTAWTTIMTVTEGSEAYVVHLFLYGTGHAAVQRVQFREDGATAIFDWPVSPDAGVHLSGGNPPLLEIDEGTFQFAQTAAVGTLYVICTYYEKITTPS